MTKWSLQGDRTALKGQRRVWAAQARRWEPAGESEPRRGRSVALRWDCFSDTFRSVLRFAEMLLKIRQEFRREVTRAELKEDVLSKSNMYS